MKKLLIALVLGLLLVAALATVAMADNGPHGGFTATTDACASCHRAHSAKVGANSLLVMDPEALCLSCHDGLGAGTNVEDGVYSQAGSDAFTGVAGSHVEGVDGASLFGGGFVNALMATAWSGKYTFDGTFSATSKLTTSTHDIGAFGTVWGSGANNTANGTMNLECTSCHDPHGNAGFTNTGTVNAGMYLNGCDPTKVALFPCTTKVASYRLLRWQPQGSNGFSAPVTSVNWSGGAFPLSGTASGWTVPDNFATLGTEWYTVGSQLLGTCGTAPATYACGPFAAGDYMNGNGNSVYQPLNTVTTTTQNYLPSAVNAAFFCAQCHDRYFNNSRLRNATDASFYCGTPVLANVTAILPYQPDADGVAPWLSPVDVLCEPVVNALGVLTGWGDNTPSGDNTYMYRHASGDIRLSMDGNTAAGTGATLSRSCVACHVSHGTTAAMTTLASNASLATGSTLLRMDNRSVCLRCHAGNVNFVVGP